MAIKKFKVMASNAKEPDGKCIPKSMRRSVESACGKKKAVKASDSECKYRIDIFKKDNPDALVKREVKTFNSEDEAKKYGESIANGGIVNVMRVNAGCTKKSVKSGRLLFPWEVEGEFADGYRYTAKGNSEAECVEKLADMQDKHGELVWYSGTTDEYYDAGRLIDSACTKKSVKSSIKATTELNDFYNVIYDMDGTWENPTTGWVGKCEIYQRDLDDGSYLFSLVFGDNESEPDEILFVPSEDKFTIYPNSGMPRFANSLSEFKRELKQEYSYLRKVSDSVTSAEKSVKSSKSLTVPKSKRKSVEASKTDAKSVKKFGVKASATAKRIAKSRITASDYRDEDIVMYFNGDNVYTGSIYDLAFADAVENLCYDDEVNAKFQEWCNQFGDPFDFDGSPIDTARVFTDIIIHEADEAPETENGGSQFYEDGNGILDFEIFYANDGIYSAKSIHAYIDEYPNWVYDWSESKTKKNKQLYDSKLNEWYDMAESMYPNFYELKGEDRKNAISDVNKAVGFTMDDVFTSIDIQCSDADGIADEWEDIREVSTPTNYSIDYSDDSEAVEYLESFINDSYDLYIAVDYVEYRGSNDWVVGYKMGADMCVSDFAYFVGQVDPDLYSQVFDNYDEYDIYDFIYGTEIHGQFYPYNGQLDTPSVDFDTDFMGQLGLDTKRFRELATDYYLDRYNKFKDVQVGLEDDLITFGEIINGSTNIKAGLSLNLNAKPNYTDWMLRGYKFDGEDVTTLRIDFQDDVKQAVMDMFADPDIETVDLYKIPTEQETTGVFEDEEYFTTFTREDINSSVDIEAGITVGEDSRFDFSNPIYELDDYVKAIADGVVTKIQGITYDISKETIAFFDEDNNVVFVQPIGGIIPEPDDLETDIDELSAAIKSEMDNAYARDNWESDEDDSDYASRAVELSEDIGEVDIDDLEPITGDGDDENIDYGFGFDSNGDPIDESTVEELYRIAEYEILPKSELAKIDEYVSIDEDSWDFYMSSPHVTEKFYIHFELTEKDIDFNDYTLPDGKMFPDFNYYTAVLDFDIYAENGEITSVILEDKKVYRPDGAFDDYDVKRFDKLYNVDAIINYVEALAADTVMDIYNGTTNL